MGYTSDVELMFYPLQFKPDPVHLSVIKLWFDENYPVEEAADWSAVITVGGDHIRVSYNGVKWYSGYGHVEEVMSVLTRFEEVFDNTAACELMRVGEELSDNEHYQYGDAQYRLQLHREILIN